MSETIFLTGGTGYIGSYVVDHLLRTRDDRIALLVRAKDRRGAEEKLWRALQLHRSAEEFWDGLGRIDFVHGDLTAHRLGMDELTWARVARTTDSILHIAASLNRKSAKECFNVNLRGTLSVLRLARAAAERGGLRRFSEVSTSAVAGKRSHETLGEDEMVDWDRSDYDPYARTKKLTEHMAHELLEDVPHVVFRPSSVVGDSRFGETTQFDMARMCMLSELPVIPVDPNGRWELVNADWVGKAIATIHTKPDIRWDSYNLTSGEASNTADEITRALVEHDGRRMPILSGRLEGPMTQLIDLAAAIPGKNQLTLTAALMKVFWPYMIYDTVFRNDRAVAEVGEAPVPFVQYCGRTYAWVKSVGWKYPYQPLPERRATVAVPEARV